VPHAVSVFALAKGAIWIMTINKLKMSAVAAVVLSIAVPAAVVSVRWMSSREKPVPVTVARVPATNSATTQATTAPLSEDWRARFAAVYRLDDGQVLKLIAPPFIPERNRYFADHQINQFGNMQNGISVFRWGGGEVEWNRWSGGPRTVENVLCFCAQIPRYKIEMEEFDRMRRIDGDWVIRAGATEDDLVAAIARQIGLSTEWLVYFQKKMMEREVFVAHGKYNPTGKPPTAGEPPLIHLFVDKHGKPNNLAVGDVSLFLTTLGETMNTEVIDETGDGQRKGAYWTDHVSSGVTGEFREKLLQNVTEQTGITFTRERRMREVWVAVTDRL
jgi:hypothetical protein